jgi:hypothetical protein
MLIADTGRGKTPVTDGGLVVAEKTSRLVVDQ